MVFNSYSFAGLVICVIFLYYLPFLKRWQLFTLIFGSLVFYGHSEPRLLVPLLSLASINIIASYLVCYGNPGLRKAYATAGVAINLAVLTYYKYWGHMPLGLSFITFQQISLLVDAFRSGRIDQYRGLIARSKAKHALNVMLFIAFFPKLAAGPIMKAHDFLPQIGTKHLKDIDWGWTIRALIVGYFLKMVVADNLKDFTFWMAFPYFQIQSTETLLALTFGYSMQLFADFAGYSLIATGVASLFGYRLIDNFNFPYISQSFSEFWTRWHISLSSFLKEYLYVPLGGNRKGRARTYLNLMIVMFLGGLWHGVTWNFGIWGLCHGIFLTAERLTLGRVEKPSSKLIGILRMIVVFTAVSFAWLLFVLTDFSHTVKYFQALFHNTSVWTQSDQIVCIFIYACPVILYHLYYLYKKHAVVNRLARFEYLAYGAMLFLIIMNSGSPSAFVYFRF